MNWQTGLTFNFPTLILSITVLLLLLLPLLVGAETNLGFFNASLPSSALLPSFTLSLRSSISLSFRTCSSGQLMSQRGRSGDAFNISLTTEGALSIAWTSSSSASSSASDSLLVEGIDFQSNQWFTIDSRFETGEIFLSVELGSQPKFKTLLSNSTLRRYLWDLKLSGGEGVLVGSGFTGCIQGLTIPLDSEDRQSSNVEWGDCPLKLQNGCEDVANPCWSYPCLNGGTCKREGADYFCECPFAFSGANCEADLGEKGCSLLPCQNNGTCEPKEGGTRRYDCLCPPGFTGVNCEIDIDDCAPGPCQNEASCLDLVDGYICNCTATGYRGHNCDENIDECDELNPCSNAATCIDSPGSYKCQCPSGIGGMNCDTLLDECSSNPCQNKGTCLDLSGFYSCQCAPDFTGINCDEQIDDCEGVVCPDLNSFCVDGNTSYSCECQFGYVPTGPDAASRCIEVNECDSNPCLNGATCEDSLGQFICNCSRGFTGLHCETDINFCADDPCSNGAECADGVESFTCECLAGYTGITCDVNINECDPNPCRNGKQCTDKVAGFTCDCGDAYEGEFCETEVDECKANPCQNGATCDDQVGRFACSCLDGFTGDRCETNIDDCPVDICLNGGRCVDGINNYTCECVGGWTGLHCDQIYDACSPNPCQEGTVCSSTPPSLDFSCTCQSVDECFSYEICSNNRCQCPFGFGGSECAENIDDCASSPCLNGATCVDRVGGYECKCVGEQVDLTAYTGDNRTIYRIGFEGDNCEVAIDECAYSPNICLNGGRYCQLKRSYCLVHDQPGAPLCYNGGTCNDLNDSYSCDCAPGFTDASCETNIDECDSNPCVNGATCEDGVNGYTCFCPPGFTGFNCEADIDECGSMPCMNGGQCQDLVNRFVCNCTDTGYEGVQCEENIDECLSNPCFHGATCSDAIKGFTCNCHNGYTGDLCEVDVDECLDSKCANGATCVQRSEDPSRPGFSYADADSYDCLCAAGFTGVFCDFDIDECKSNPCLNGGSCMNGINAYICECDSGFTGTNCEINIDECALHTPCRNNGKCVDLVADYLCDCSPGGVAYGGKNCTFLFDICEQNLCHNYATCVPKLLNEEYRIQEYSCDCSPGFSGEHCEFSTVASFYGASWLRSDRTSNHDSTTITLDFRTTLPRGTLWENSGESSAEYVLVELLNGSDLRLVYNNRLQRQDLLLSTLSSSSLNNGAWHTVSVSVTRLRVEMQLNHVDCVASQCVTGFDFNHANVSVQHHDLGLTYFGGSPTPRVTPLIGCLRDILIDTFAILPQDYLSSDNSDNLQLGCNRSEQCTLHSCSNHGACNDLWFDFECECTRPYFGDICLTSFTPVTFGYEGAASSASFPISESEKITHQTKNDISLFFRTRASVGVIFYLGSANTYLTARMGNSQVIVESKLSLTKESFAINGDFSDGLQHFLLVNRTDSNLMLSVDSLSEEFTIKSDDLLVAENFYFGREPQEESRRRKKRSTEDDECFRGTMQDVRCNKHILQFSPVNQTTDLPSYGNPIMQNVTIGEISDDVCASQLPCTNNATCQVVFFNDFKCNCVDGYRGKNCSEPDFCFYATCPGESLCENLDDGFECLKPATFNGISSLIQYSSSIAESNALSTINVDFRTRQDSGTILHAKGIDNHASHYVTVEMSDSVLSVKFNLGAEGSITSVRNEPFLQDGDWHNVTVTFNQDSVEMTIDNAHQYQTILRQDFTVAQILQGSSSIYVGGKSGNPSGALSFKGCLDAVRLSGRLLPFYNKTEIVGNHAAQQFIAEQLIDVETSCVGDPVCDSNPCQNGATCLDIWNEYECDCAVGFNGSKCDFNIDECEMHQCQNGATCVDAIANYTCGCSPGFIGWRCEVDIDECSSDPCLNNGTCWDQVDGYICNCTDNFTGDYCEYSVQVVEF
ncbi:hypothetical protein CAPTEDRAFT_215070 [Capitella teleta]|uniref:Protein crumbs n=1 Tax=Capitella teleta TaxID=283909 RepID=R7URB5_CAPTE|nr:hypothetical protein CAPTEDRAFT_215070 [Capitella teleta]|eukprot:ELU08663.1 hypothetical protein CAPTEDRAFT_215070 [Capitella teleta]